MIDLPHSDPARALARAGFLVGSANAYDAAVSDTLAVIAATWGVLMAASPVLQIRRMLVTRSSADLSLSYLVVLLIGFAIWLSYGLSIANAAIIVPNVVALVIGLATVLVALRFRTART